MWNGSANATWFQTPVASPSSCGSCEASSLTRDALYGGSSFIDGYVANGHDRSKFVVGYATSCVTGFTGTDQLSVAWSDSYADNPLFIVEGMTSYGGTWTHDATAKASYIHGTAAAGNPMGFSAGTKFFLPFEDSTDMKAGIDYLKSIGAGGVMFYDFYGDRRSGQTENWKRTPYIYAASVYAASLTSGGVSSCGPTIKGVPLPIAFSLEQNYPNPFNPSTSFDFSLPKRAFIRLTIFNLLGEHIVTLVDGEKDAGVHHVIWDASNCSSGTYFYKLQVGNFLGTKKLLLLK
jgi:hypothetical protein